MVDVDGGGTVGWAGVAFGPLLNRTPRQVVGQPLSALIAPRDREALAKTLMTGTRGRIVPTILRLANATETRCVVTGLAMDGPNKRFFLTVGRPPEPGADAAAPIKPSQAFGIGARHRGRGDHKCEDFPGMAPAWARNQVIA